MINKNFSIAKVPHSVDLSPPPNHHNLSPHCEKSFPRSKRLHHSTKTFRPRVRTQRYRRRHSHVITDKPHPARTTLGRELQINKNKKKVVRTPIKLRMEFCGSKASHSIVGTSISSFDLELRQACGRKFMKISFRAISCLRQRQRRGWD